MVHMCGPTPKSGCGRPTENGGGESEGPKTGGGQLGKIWGGNYKCSNFGENRPEIKKIQIKKAFCASPDTILVNFQSKKWGR